MTIYYNNSAVGSSIRIDYNEVTHVITGGAVVAFVSYYQFRYAGDLLYSHTDGSTIYEVRALNSSPYAYVTSRPVPTCTVAIASAPATNATTPTSADGSITINATGSGNYTYLLTGGPDNVNIIAFSNVFPNLKAGVYSVLVQSSVNGNTCVTPLQYVTVGYNTITCDLVLGTVTTSLAPGATLTVVNYTTSLNEPVEYRLGTGAWQSSNIFTGLAAGTYSVQIRFKNFPTCVSSRNVTVSAAVLCDITITATLITAEQTRFGNNGSVAISATSTNGTITYSKDGVTYQASSLLDNLSPGTITIYAKDAGNCIATKQVTIPAYKSPVVEFPIANSHRVVITSGPPADNTGVQNYDNVLLAKMKFPFERETWSYYQLLTTADITRVQWRSNYNAHVLRVFKVSDNSLVDTIFTGKKTSYLNKPVSNACYITAGNTGYTQVYFDNGLPYYYQIGMPVTISGVAGMNGNYIVKDILPGIGSALGYQVLLLQVAYTPVPAVSNGTLAAVYNVEDWEVWEATIGWGNYAVGQYYFTITGTDDAFVSFIAQSEPVDVQTTQDDTIKIEFLNLDNAFKIDYTTGIKHLLRISARLALPKNGGQITGMEDSVRRYIKLQEIVTRLVDLEVWDVPFYLMEKLAVALAHDTVTINGINYATEEKIEATEYEMDVLMTARVRLRQVNFQNENQTDSGGNVSSAAGQTSSTMSLKRYLLDTGLSTITMDMRLLDQVAFYAPAPISAAKTWTFTNDANAVQVPFLQFTIGTVAVQTFGSNVTMAKVIGDWDDTNKQWLPPAPGDYKASFAYNGTKWVMEITGPLY